MDRRGFLGLVAASALHPAADRPVRALAQQLDGDVVAKGSPRYAAALQLWDSRFDGLRPRAIAYCANAADVQRTVRWGRAHGVRIVPRSGGHSYGGYSSGNGVVVADVSRLHGVAVGAGTASVGAGTNLISMYAGLAAHGVTVPGGTCPTVGIAGLALGGGYGYAARLYGLTSDNLRSVRIVTGDGSLLTCDASNHSDLFWACRGGGGGNFGIATSFVFRTHPAPHVVTYQLQWPAKHAVDAFAAWQEFAPTAPDALTSAFELLSSPPHAPNIVSTGQYFGSVSGLRTLLEPLMSTGTPTLVTSTVPYLQAVLHWAQCSVLASCTNKRVDFDARSDYVTEPLPPKAAAILVDAVATRRGGPGYVLIDAYGGAINRIPKTATAFVHRDALFSIQYAAEPGGSWLDDLYAAMRPYASGYAYQNYIDPKLASWQHAYYGANLARLQAVKRTYDPDNAFRFAQSIR